MAATAEMEQVETEARDTMPGGAVVLYDVDWDLYERLLAVVGNRPVRLTYDSGRLEIMSPLPDHERWKKRIGRLVEALSEELGMEIVSLGSTTFRDRKLNAGLEPDECYYIQNEAAVRNIGRIDLQRDPAPDLVVEVDLTHRAADRSRIYAAMGVPEMWRYHRDELEALGLGHDGQYHRIEQSLAFPSLKVEDLQRFVTMSADRGETSALRAFREWVRTTLKK
jgi:Uma2 family endonuclease